MDGDQHEAEVTVLRPYLNYMHQNVKVCQDGLKALSAHSEEMRILRSKIRSKAGTHDDRLDMIKTAEGLLSNLCEDVLHNLALAEGIEDEAQAKLHNDTLDKHVKELVSCKDMVGEVITKSKSYMQSL